MNKIKTSSIYLMLILVLTCLIFAAFTPKPINVFATNNIQTNCKGCVLIERNSQQILYEKDAHSRHPIASVTKLMTILLTLEEIENGSLNLDDSVFVSKNANGMGGSQIFLDANEKYTVENLLKSVIVCSANDSSVALAEHIAGSENNFVRLMNEKVNELNLNNTFYSNCTGLPSNDAYSSAYDQAVILNKVLNCDIYQTYSSIWMEDFIHPSGRTTQMTNTNKLSRFYPGCIGGKTGSTNQAKFCLAVGAKRNDMSLISVVLGAENSKERFQISSNLLNYGFENFQSKTLFSDNDLVNKTIKIKGLNNSIKLKAEKEYAIVTDKNKNINYSLNFNLPNQLLCVKENQIVGNIEIVLDGKVVEKINIISQNTYNEASLWDYFKEIIK